MISLSDIFCNYTDAFLSVYKQNIPRYLPFKTTINTPWTPSPNLLAPLTAHLQPLCAGTILNSWISNHDFFISHLTFTFSFWILPLSMSPFKSICNLNICEYSGCFSSFFLPYFSSIWKNWLLPLFSISHPCPSFLVFLLASGCSFLVSLPPPSKIFIKCSSFSGTLDDLTKVYTFSILSVFE